MSKANKKIDNRQLTIFEYLTRAKEAKKADSAGIFACIDRLRAAIRAGIKDSPLSVHQIAGEMSHLLDETVTAEQIYSWTRASDEQNGRPGRHIPAEYLPAFCKATGHSGVIEIMGEMIGLFVLPGPDALRSEIARDDEDIKAAKERKRQRMALLKEMEWRREREKG
jgi:hypothetical protein